ncbi:MAG: hypothetical protein R2708_12930 [Vicinamibacterales bacterium]
MTALVGLLTYLSTTPVVGQQALGTFIWQLQPFCNRVTVQVTQAGGLYTAEGYDDQCGAPQRAPLVGTIAPNPDGSIGFGLHVVTVPGGRGLQIDARIALATLSGSWRDSAGNTGTFAFNAANGGSPRPQPTIPGSAIAPGSITAAQIAAGSITAAQINPSVVQRRVTGMCANGQALRGVNPDGTVACTDALTTVDEPANSVGYFSSIAIGADNLPVISHFDGTALALRVTHCGNAACTADNVSTIVDDPAGAVGSYSSIAIGTDGLPLISHRDSAAGALRVTHCGNVTCTAGNISRTIDDPVNLVGFDTSIAIGTDGLPVISHRDGTAGALRVTHCGTIDCSAGVVSTTVDTPTDSVGWHSSLAIGLDGLPVISHGDLTTATVRVTHCGNAACTTGNVSSAVGADWDAFLGGSPTIAIGIDGGPVVAYSSSSDALRVAKCGNASCTTGNVVSTVDPSPQSGVFPSIAVGADGLPVIAHQRLNISHRALAVTHCGNAACTSGNQTRNVDSPAVSVGYESSIAIGSDGLPVIGYRAFEALRVAKCGTPTCQ